jgi:hypothetical protein
MIYHMGSYEMPSVDCNLDDLASVVDAAVQAIQPHRWGFDSIIATGMSGVLVAVPAALQLGCPVVIFRKDSDYCAQGTGSIINRIAASGSMTSSASAALVTACSTRLRQLALMSSGTTCIATGT